MKIKETAFKYASVETPERVLDRQLHSLWDRLNRWAIEASKDGDGVVANNFLAACTVLTELRGDLAHRTSVKGG